MKRPPIRIVGCGPGAPDYLIPLARRAVEEAQVLVGARRLLDLFPHHPGERIEVGSDIAGVLRAIEDRLHLAVAVLVTGDPGLGSLAQPVLTRFGPAACKVIPGISSVQVAFARLGLDWGDARIVDLHQGEPALGAAELASEKKIAFLAGRKESLPWIARLLSDLAGRWRIHALEDLTLPGEAVREIQAHELNAGGFSSRTIIVLIRP